MAQKGWFIDLAKCVGCESCTVACKAELNTPPDQSPLEFNREFLGSPKHVSYRFVVFRENGTYPNPQLTFVSSSCNHCEKPACLAVCPLSDESDPSNTQNVIVKRGEDGLVLINQETCIGCRYCVWACPYGAPRFNEETEKVEKCTFCEHRQAAGLEPACATTCVGRALHFVEDFDLRQSGQNAPAGFADSQLTKPAIRFNPK